MYAYENGNVSEESCVCCTLITKFILQSSHRQYVIKVHYFIDSM